MRPAHRRSRIAADQLVQARLNHQRHAIEQLSARLDLVAQQADRADAALTELDGQVADLEAATWPASPNPAGRRRGG